MRLTFEKYTPLAFLMGLALLIGLSLISYRSLNDLIQTADQLTNTHLVMSKLEEVLSDFKDVIGGYRGYALTGKDSYLDLYYEGRRNVDLEFQELRNPTVYNSRQKFKLDEIERLKQLILRLSEEIIETRRTRGFDAALALLERDRGQPLMIEIRQKAREMEAEEDRLLRLREAAARSSARRAKMILAAGSSVGVILTTLAILAVRRELDRRKRAEAALRQSNVELERRVAERTSEVIGVTQRLRFALDGARLGAWSADLLSGRFWADDASKTMHGFEPGQTVNTIEEAGANIHPEDLPVIAARIRAAVQDHAGLEYEYRVIMPDGSKRWIAASGQIIQWDLDWPQSFKMFGIVQDITERKQTETERERLLANEHAARQAAEEASRMKDEFLAVLSHELRSPLNAIVGYANLMRDGRCRSEEAPRMLDIVLRNARTQQQLIDDMLDVSRIITGKMGLSLGPVEPKAVVKSALDTARPAAEAKQITFDVKFDPSVGAITGDAKRLQQAVWNLLSNAVKFTPAGGKVSVRLTREDSYVEIMVSDTGKGISPEYLPHVFNRFSQEDYSITRQYGGLGLGLSIVRHVAELHGGSVRAASEGEGRGATFVIRLPMGVGPTAEPRNADSHKLGGHEAPETARGGELPLDGARVLVVDDDADTRQLLKRVLEIHGAAVKTAASAAEALGMIAASPPDALVADIGMPGEDGYSLMRKIRKLPSRSGGTVPALALTAYARPEDRARALTAGFQQYVAKPVEPDELAAVVAELTGRMDAPSHI
jgi:signal transduction histidine kinase/CHASE3 domain sensor protein/ActR/RegA family two-component response regulator